MNLPLACREARERSLNEGYLYVIQLCKKKRIWYEVLNRKEWVALDENLYEDATIWTGYDRGKQVICPPQTDRIFAALTAGICCLIAGLLVLFLCVICNVPGKLPGHQEDTLKAVNSQAKENLYRRLTE